MGNDNAHTLLGNIRLPWEHGLSLLCTASYGGIGSKYHCDALNTYYALDFDRPWEGNTEPETSILAIADGMVVFASEDQDNMWGLNVKIIHSNGVESLYAHLKHINPNLRIGQKVKQGKYLGLLGESGKADGPHLHFQLFVSGKCYKKIVGAKPEPLSGYCNLHPGNWYRSNNHEI